MLQTMTALSFVYRVLKKYEGSIISANMILKTVKATK